MSLDAAEQAIRDADLDRALQELQGHVRAHPSDVKPRVFLFQLLSVLGQWERAHTQLNVAAELDASALAMAQMYRAALHCEALRADVFAGKKAPTIFGEPEEWMALLVESLLTSAEPGSAAAARAQALRDRAFEAAPATAGSIDGTPFEWIADADSRLGPVCEAVINGRYCWVPFARLARIDIEAPADLRDVVWTPVHFEFANGGDAVAVIPTRYTGSEGADDAALRLARKTEWVTAAPEVFHGLGQRCFATNAGEFALMDVRTIVLSAGSEPSETQGRG
jgi:type VI secretion system protein ImpE